MLRNLKEAYIVAGKRTAVGVAKSGAFRSFKPEDLAVTVVRELVASVPYFEPSMVEGIFMGNAAPGMQLASQVGRIVAQRALGMEAPGIIINRYCASGLESIALATAKIQTGQAECIIAGGVESISSAPATRWDTVHQYTHMVNEPDYFLNMALTAEQVAKDFDISREQQDTYSLRSHQKAVAAINAGYLKNAILPVDVDGKIVDRDECPRADINMDELASLKPLFPDGTLTTGNASPLCDGAAFVMVMSENMVKELEVQPMGRLIACSSAVGSYERKHGLGCMAAIPAALKQADLTMSELDLIELNEAFAAQSIAAIKESNLNPDLVNINGGAIAFGHAMGSTGTRLSIQLLNDLKRTDKRFGMVTACVGSSQGIAGVFESF
ncbi:MAG: thiolase family protein [Niabella sp.]